MDEEAMLLALAKIPGDAAPRLAYSAWLAERGDPRAAYLRVEDRLRTTPLGMPVRREQGQVWRAARAEVDPAWLSRVEVGAPVPAWVPSAARNPPHLGLEDWFGWASRSHYEWILLAALAPIEAVARTLIANRSGIGPAASVWKQAVPVERGRNHDSVGGTIPFVQLHGHAWTVAMYSTFSYSSPANHAAETDARNLSAQLGTLAVTYAAENTSSATAYHLFECGELIEYAEDAPGEARFASKRRPLPLPITPRHFPADLFRAMGLYIPGFYASGTGVRLDVPEVADVARADLLDIRQPSRVINQVEMIQYLTEFPEIHQLYDEGYEPSGRLRDGVEEDEDDIPF